MAENIQVVVRCRARNQREVAAKSPPIVELPNDTFSANEPFVSVTSGATLFAAQTAKLVGGKVFKVDQVYGPGADQALLFANVALPLLYDFLAGLNVTLLAYGQTGLGKTYSMCGDLKGDHAGIIPRVLTKLFAAIDGDCVVKLSCVELYKEELHDLINDELDLVAVKLKLRLVNDARDAMSTTIQNLTEVHIDNCEMGFKILQKCLTKRRTSATKLNDHSSRSHTIFTINLYKRVDSSAGTPAYRVSKMNLVDLAGSEDINKSGAVNERAREAGSINQSLLTLGKVINSLSEGKEPRHIPYRESKLTRLLQGSIGGKTKTALIATISPAKINAQETLSTLNYASKAKNIRNLPQSTQDSDLILKKVLVSDLSAQIARLTRDLIASKDKDGGIKMSVDNYEEFNTNIASLQTSLNEESFKAKGLETKLDAKNKEIEDLQAQLKAMEEHNAIMKKEFHSKSDEVSALNSNIVKLQEKYTSQKKQVSQVMKNNLQDVSSTLRQLLQSVSSESGKLGSDLESSKSTMLQQLQLLQAKFDTLFGGLRDILDKGISKTVDDIMETNFNLSGCFSELRQFNLEGEIKKLASVNDRHAEQIHSRLSPELYESRITENTKHFSYDLQLLKRRLLAEMANSMNAMFEESLANLEQQMKTSASDILGDSRAEIQKVMAQAAIENKEALSLISTKSTKLQEKLSDVERRTLQMRGTASAGIAHGIKNKVGGALQDITNSSSKGTQKMAEHIKSGLDGLASKMQHTSTTTINSLESATDELQAFNCILENLDASPDAKARPNMTSVRSPTRFASPEAKRRKPMSPLKNDNGLYGSRIPQLSHK